MKVGDREFVETVCVFCDMTFFVPHRDQGVTYSSALILRSESGGGGHSASFQRREMECFMPPLPRHLCLHRTECLSLPNTDTVQIIIHEPSVSILLHLPN